MEADQGILITEPKPCLTENGSVVILQIPLSGDGTRSTGLAGSAAALALTKETSLCSM